MVEPKFNPDDATETVDAILNSFDAAGCLTIAMGIMSELMGMEGDVLTNAMHHLGDSDGFEVHTQ